MEASVKFWLLGLTLLSGQLIAQELEAEKAAAYFEAKDYIKSMDLYEVLLKQNVTPWQKSVLQYNRGCVLFAEGNFSAAVAEWRAIPLSKDSFPLLSRRIHTNLAVARLQQANHLILDQTSAFEKGHFYLQEALVYVRMAMDDECRLQKLEGASICLPEKDLTLLLAAIKSQYAKGAKRWGHYEQFYASPSQRLFLLLGSISLLQQRLRFLSGQTENTYSYRTIFAEEGRLWLPVWESTGKEIPKLNKQGSKLFSKAKAHYEESLSDMERKAYPESLAKLDEALNNLMELANQIGLNKPIATTIRHLLSSYQLAFIEEPMQELAIAELLAQQQAVLEPLRPSLDADQLKILDLTNKDLALSQDALKRGFPLTGRFYFAEARYRLTKILRPVKRGSEPTPLQILANAMDDQHQAVILKRLAERMEGSEHRDEAIMERIAQAQKSAVEEAATFLEAVYIQQVNEFRQPGSLEERCQAHPWDEALPLYEKGFRAANHAYASKGIPLYLQEEALHNWNQALSVLKKPKSAFKGTCQKTGGGGGASTEKDAEKTAPKQNLKNENPSVPMNQVMRNIQKMEEEDRQQQKAPAPPKGEKPW